MNSLQIYEKFVVHCKMLVKMRENNVKNTDFLGSFNFLSQFSKTFKTVTEDEESL